MESFDRQGGKSAKKTGMEGLAPLGGLSRRRGAPQVNVTIDRDACYGCGLCVEKVPEVFEMGKDGIATVKANAAPLQLADLFLSSADYCPIEAIKVGVIKKGGL